MDTEGNMVLNLGPHHPATHGVLRLATEVDGEVVVRISPELGYLHSGFEKTGENIRYEQFIPYCDRMDYMAPMSNNLAYVDHIETLMEVEFRNMFNMPGFCWLNYSVLPVTWSGWERTAWMLVAPPM
jgi:NADH:ubiquinone oxidoreductase subunit D